MNHLLQIKLPHTWITDSLLLMQIRIFHDNQQP